VEEDFQRGYLVTLLGQAMRYLFYAGFGPARGDCLFLCQLLAARLAKPSLTPLPVPFSVRPTPVFKHGALVEEEHNGYLLRASRPRAYASLTIPDPGSGAEFFASCDLLLLEAAEGGWCALCAGVDPSAPERSGIGAMLRLDPAGQATIAILSHRDSRHRSPPVILHLPSDRRLLLELSLRGNLYTFSVSSPAGSSSPATTSLAAPSQRYRGGLATVAHKLDLRLHSFSVSVGAISATPLA
jgi:hypothetical protein